MSEQYDNGDNPKVTLITSLIGIAAVIYIFSQIL